MIRDCCKKNENLELIEERKNEQDEVVLRVHRCKICSRRHYEALAAPGHIGVDVKAIG